MRQHLRREDNNLRPIVVFGTPAQNNRHELDDIENNEATRDFSNGTTIALTQVVAGAPK
ncbi:MAG: hypothetical protein ACLP00_30015 [Terracidiphilus sp.]